jgi:A118 family predicted phage portal protein
MGVTIAMSNDMARAIYQWNNAYMNRAPWLNEKDGVRSLELPATICSEMARIVTMESAMSITGNERADFIKKQILPVLHNLRHNVEFACAKGGIIFKPYRSGSGIAVDIVHADNFFPVTFNSNGEITAAIFPEFKKDGNRLYIRLEYQSLEGDTYVIKNRAFYSENASVKINDILRLGTEIPLGVVKEWEDLEPETELGGITKPLFSYFRVPLGNNIDPNSQLGVSVFSRAMGDIMDADMHYGATMWEYRSKETGSIWACPAAKRKRTNVFCFRRCGGQKWKSIL